MALVLKFLLFYALFLAFSLFWRSFLQYRRLKAGAEALKSQQEAKTKRHSGESSQTFEAQYRVVSKEGEDQNDSKH